MGGREREKRDGVILESTQIEKPRAFFFGESTIAGCYQTACRNGDWPYNPCCGTMKLKLEVYKEGYLVMKPPPDLFLARLPPTGRSKFITSSLSNLGRKSVLNSESALGGGLRS